MCAYAKRLLVSHLSLAYVLLLVVTVTIVVGDGFPRNLEAGEPPHYDWDQLAFGENLRCRGVAVNQVGDVVGEADRLKYVQFSYDSGNTWEAGEYKLGNGFISQVQSLLMVDLNDWFEEVAEKEQWPQYTFQDGTVMRYPIAKGEGNHGWRIVRIRAVNNMQEMLGQALRFVFNKDSLRYERDQTLDIRITFENGEPRIDTIWDLFLSELLSDKTVEEIRVSRADMNDNGDITGNWMHHDPDSGTVWGSRGFFYDALAQQVVDIGDLGRDGVWPRSINADAQITGIAYYTVDPNTTRNRAFRYSPDTGMQNLGVLKNVVDGISDAWDINDLGQVVGKSSVKKETYHAFRYTDGVGMVSLGTLGGNNSEAFGINNHGSVVGWSEISGSGQRAFLYTDALGMLELESLIKEWPEEYMGFLEPWKINDDGFIIAQNQLTRQMVILRPITGEVGVQVKVVDPSELFVSGNNVPVTAEATSPAKIQAVTFFIEGDPEQVILKLTGKDLGNDLWSATWDTTTDCPDGLYTIRAVATDLEGASAEDSIEVWVQNNEPPQPLEMTIEFTKVASEPVGRNHWQASVTVTVSDQSDNSLEGALVTGIWDDGKVETIASPAAVFQSDQIHRRINSVTFTVTGVELEGYIWNPDPQDVVSITIPSP